MYKLCGCLQGFFYASLFVCLRCCYIQCPVHISQPLPFTLWSTLSSYWWRWCRCPAWWSFAGSHGGSSCLPASLGCGQRLPACPPFGRELTGRRGEGSGTPASRPPPAHAGLAASHTPLHTKKRRKKKKHKAHKSITVVFQCELFHVISSEQPIRLWLLMGL